MPSKTEPKEETKELVIAPQSLAKYTDLSPDQLLPIAEMMVKAKLFSDVHEVAIAYVKILAGQEMGIAPFAAMTGIHIIQGRPSVGGNLMAAKVKASGKYDYKIIRQDNDACEIEFFQNHTSLGKSTFTKEDAKAAGTQNMGKYPRNMLFNRAISNGVKWYAPDVFMGQTVYTPEELGADVNEDGDIPPTPYSAANDATEGEIVTPTPPKPRPQTMQEAIGEMMGTIKTKALEAGHTIDRDEAVKMLLYLAKVSGLVDIKASMVPALKVSIDMLDGEVIATVLLLYPPTDDDPRPPKNEDVVITDLPDTEVDLSDIPF